MKVIIYQDQKKITVGNISIPNFSQLKEDIYNEYSEMSLEELQSYNFQITSTCGVFNTDGYYDNDLQKEIEEGINWQQVTVN